MERCTQSCSFRKDVIALCKKRLNKAGISPSELSPEGLKLLILCSIRDRLTATSGRY